MVAPTNASKWRMGFNSAFKGLMLANYLIFLYRLRYLNSFSLSFDHLLKLSLLFLELFLILIIFIIIMRKLYTGCCNIVVKLSITK
jgi:hypothetical protein